MTNEAQIKALAELDGLTLHILNGVTYCWSEERNKNLPPDDDGMMVIPKYLTSYDAIIPLIQKQDRPTQIALTKLICGHNGLVKWIRTTPPQLCEALLRATKIWPE